MERKKGLKMNKESTFILNSKVAYRNDTWTVEEILEDDTYLIKKVDGRKKVTVKRFGNTLCKVDLDWKY